MGVTLRLSLGRRDTIRSFLLVNYTATHTELSDVLFGHPNDIRSFIIIGMKVVALATHYSQPKEKPLRHSVGRDQIISGLESPYMTVTQVVFCPVE